MTSKMSYSSHEAIHPQREIKPHVCSIIPPTLLLDIIESKDISEDTRAAAQKSYGHCCKLKNHRKIKTDNIRSLAQGAHGLAAGDAATTAEEGATVPAAAEAVDRKIYSSNKTSKLRQNLLWSEGDDLSALSSDVGAQEVTDFFGKTWQFYKEVFDRASVDDNNLELIGSLHYDDVPGPPGMDNAFWDGDEMAFGDGDGEIFGSFTKNIDVIGHELTHGVTQYTANLEYEFQAGALNESMSDVFGTMIKQYFHGDGKQLAKDADWLIGEGIFLPSLTNAAALRSMKAPGTAYNNPKIGKDRQPADMSKYQNMPNTDAGDNGGVHINSGIPNRAFYLASIGFGGHSWEKAGKIWYAALNDKKLKGVDTKAAFKVFADLTSKYALSLFDKEAQAIVKKAWTDVKVYGAAAAPKPTAPKGEL